jgi:hypothetical protein
VPIIIQRKEAAANFQRFYFTGRPCKRGHIADRVTVNSDCVECVRERQRLQYKQRTPEQNQRRNELLAQQRREMSRDDASSVVRRTLAGLGHVMQSLDAQERSARLNAAIKAGANYIRQDHHDAQN